VRWRYLVVLGVGFLVAAVWMVLGNGRDIVLGLVLGVFYSAVGVRYLVDARARRRRAVRQEQ
jgi:hypothetical protein